MVAGANLLCICVTHNRDFALGANVPYMHSIFAPSANLHLLLKFYNLSSG